MAPEKIQWRLGSTPDRLGLDIAGYFLIGGLLSLLANTMVPQLGTTAMLSWGPAGLLCLLGIGFFRAHQKQARRGAEEAGTEERRCLFSPREIHTETRHIRSSWPYTSIRRLVRRGPWLVIEVDANGIVLRDEPGLEDWLRERAPAMSTRFSIGRALFGAVLLYALVVACVIASFSPHFG